MRLMLRDLFKYLLKIPAKSQPARDQQRAKKEHRNRLIHC